MDTYDALVKITKGRMKKFPNGNNPFQTLSRVLEEAGELAKATNHFEKTGSKERRYGEGSKEEVAKESVDLIQNILTLLVLYGQMAEFQKQVEKTLSRLEEQGFV